ncbi:MAG: BatA domain-containing protein [Planctomycetota bacterium]
MTFVTTGLLIAGAVSIIVPVLIHLLSRQRRRPIAWGAMRFLMEALRKHRRRLQLEQALLLLVRCLILVVLGAALARPFLEAAGILDVSGSRTVFLVIDNGLVSGAGKSTGEGPGTALAGSIEQAVGLVEALGPGDRVGVITAARPATALVVPASSDRRAIIEVLRTIEPSEAPTDLPAAFPLLRTALDELGPDQERAIVYLLSEFRGGSARLAEALPSVLAGDGIAPTLLSAAAAQTRLANVQVTAVEPLRGLVLSSGQEGTGQVTVSLRRRGGDLPRDVTRVRVVGENLPPVEPKTVQWGPGQLRSQVDFVVNLGGHGDGAVALTAVIDDDALGPDNVRHTVVLSRGRVRVLLIDRRSFGADPDLDRLRAGRWVHRALQPSDRSPIDVVEVDPAALDTVDVRGVDAAVAVRPDLLTNQGWSVLRSFVDAGGLLLVTPPGESVVHPWTDHLAQGLGLPWRIELEVVEHEAGLALAGEQPSSELLRLLSGDLLDLVRPVIAERVLPVDEQQTQAEVLLSFADGTPAIIAGSPSRGPALDPGSDNGAPAADGLVVYMAMSPELEWTNLTTQPLMVPLFHELIKQGIGLIRTSQRYAVAEQPALGLGVAAASLLDPGGRVISVDTAGRPREPLARSGLWGVLDPARQRIGTLAVNVDPAAGNTDPQNQAAVMEWLGKSGAWEAFEADNAAAAIRTADSGAPLSGLLLLAVLGLVVMETALARWFSHALPVVRDAGPGLTHLGEAAAPRGA